jgi:hypothetical protein
MKEITVESILTKLKKSLNVEPYNLKLDIHYSFDFDSDYLEILETEELKFFDEYKPTNKEIVKYYCNKNNKENLSKDLKEAIEYSIKKLYYDPASLVSDLDTKFESSEIPQVLIEAFADNELNDREFREAVYKYATEIKS